MLLQLSKTATVADHRSHCIAHAHKAHKLILRLIGSLRLHAYPVHWHYRCVLQNKQKNPHTKIKCTKTLMQSQNTQKGY